MVWYKIVETAVTPKITGCELYLMKYKKLKRIARVNVLVDINYSLMDSSWIKFSLHRLFYKM